MQIREWKISEYHGISNLDLTLPISDNGDAVILLGENGSGKSSTLEVLLHFFAMFDSPSLVNDLKSDCEISYRIGSRDVTIRQKNLEWELSYVEIGSNDVITSFHGTFDSLRRKLKKMEGQLFPQRIITFYSGYADHLAPIYKKVNQNYERECRNVVSKYLNLIKSENPVDIQLPQFPHKKYIHCDDTLTPLYLAAILAGGETYEKKKIQELCSIDDLIAIDILLEPKAAKNLLYEFFSNDIEREHKSGLEKNFWRVIDFIDSEMCAVMRPAMQAFQEDLALFMITDVERIPCDKIRIFNFFEKLVTFFDATISVRFNGKQGKKNVEMLSEGQRQLIKIIGMLGATKEADCFVMMDEPDSHMNPRWKYEIKDVIDNVLRDATNTQAIIATHDPLVVNGIENTYVRLFIRDSGSAKDETSSNVRVVIPTEDTEGMGIDGLLQSEYYGLRTSYDKKANQKFERRQILYSKLIHNEASDKEKEELRRLTEEIGMMPLSYNTIDFLYDDFIREYKKMDLYTEEYLSYEEIQARRTAIRKIIESLYKKRK